MVTELQRHTAEVARAEEQYLENETLEGTDLQEEVDARIAEANATHTAVDNDELATELNTTNATVGGGVFPVYSGGNVVNDENPLVMDELVRDAGDGDDIFHTGGQIPPTSFEDVNSLSPYLDPMFLVEWAKKTAEKPY